MTKISNKDENPKRLFVLKRGTLGHSDFSRFARAFPVLLCCFFLFHGIAGAEETPGKNWQTVETRHTSIRFLSSKDIRIFDRNLRFSLGNSGFFGFLASSGKGKGPKESVAEKVDGIYKRVQEILDMKRHMEKVIIQVYPDSGQLKEAFTRIYGRPCRIRAWYRYRNNTIYLNARDLHEGMLAHEMAHAIIDNYLTVRPPRATAEILARYVDQHLEE